MGDPISGSIAAFSLVCNVIQVVDFGQKVLSECREMYSSASGSLGRNEYIEDAAKSLANTSKDLENDLAKTPTNTSSEETQLRDLAVKSAKTAEGLLEILESIKMTGNKSKPRAFGKVVKSMWKKDKIKDLQTQVDSYQKVLETTMLSRLARRFDLANLQQDQWLANFDQRMQLMIRNLARGDTKLAEIVTKEGEATRLHFTSELVGLKAAQFGEQQRKAVLESLFFEDINVRQEEIKEVHKGTFKWILDEEGQKVLPWSNFVDWLRDGHGLYWISGKAGSGKSTIMNYICTERRSQDLLRTWAGDRELITPKFFFWNSGSKLQKTSHGLLRSLIYQILQQYPEMVSVVAGSQIATWTESRLKDTLQKLVSQNIPDQCYCFFLDGLDELDGSQQDVINIIKELQSASVKVCVSSRPQRLFELEFATSPRLKLEDLTRGDIQKYVHDKLSNTPAADLVRLLTERADGVFIWVTLAVRDVLNGVINDDSLEELRQRLRMLPQRIGALYNHMLMQIDELYERPARKFFNLMLYHQSDRYLSMLDVALASYEGTKRCITSRFEKSDWQNILALCKKLETQIPIRCAGLLEVGERKFVFGAKKNKFRPEYREILRYATLIRLRFIHVSARDFLFNDEIGQRFLMSTPDHELESRIQLVQARLGILMLFTEEKPYKVPYELNTEFAAVISQAKAINRLNEEAPLKLLDVIDKVFAKIVALREGTYDLELKSGLGGHWLFGMKWHRRIKPGQQIVTAIMGTSIFADQIFNLLFAVVVCFEGLHSYALHKLRTVQSEVRVEVASAMLLSAVAGYIWDERKSTPDAFRRPEPDIVEEFLSQGADCDMRFVVPPSEWQKRQGFTAGAGDTNTISTWGLIRELTGVGYVVQRIGKWQKGLSATHYQVFKSLLSRTNNPGADVEVVLYPMAGSDVRVRSGMWQLFDREQPHWQGMKVLLSPALVLDGLPQPLPNILPIELRTMRTKEVTAIRNKFSPKFHTISDTQSLYLTESVSTWLASGGSEATTTQLRERLEDVVADVLFINLIVPRTSHTGLEQALTEDIFETEGEGLSNESESDNMWN